MKVLKRCYNCGKELKNRQCTKEHIPSKALFDGYDSKYKFNRITVPACFDCNNQYSHIDEEFRNMIGILSCRSENATITDQSIKSIFRKDSGNKRLRLNSFGKVIGVRFNTQTIEDFQKKTFKGLFYHQYGFPLPDNYVLRVIIDENDCSEWNPIVINYLNMNFKWKCSGHSDVFTYCIQPFRTSLPDSSKEDLELCQDDNFIVSAFIYNKEYGVLVMAITKDRLEYIQKHPE